MQRCLKLITYKDLKCKNIWHCLLKPHTSVMSRIFSFFLHCFCMALNITDICPHDEECRGWFWARIHSSWSTKHDLSLSTFAFELVLTFMQFYPLPTGFFWQRVIFITDKTRELNLLTPEIRNKKQPGKGLQPFELWQYKLFPGLQWGEIST